MSTIVLGIESSCDESGAAIVQDGRLVLANVLASSAKIHQAYGGVVPEIASREHLRSIVPVISTALEEANISLSDLTAIAVTQGPGLVGSLLVGVSAAKILAASSGLPLIPVHHLAGHIAANYLVHPDCKPPFLALLVSGAHSHIVEVNDYCDLKILARTRDDAPGEAFDKIAREIGLGYPGGPLIDRLAKQGNSTRLDLPKTRFQDSLDFSFSGLKTAVLNEVNKAEMKAKQLNKPRTEILKNEDIAASFQTAVVESLLSHCEEALDSGKYKQFVVAGGVSANSHLRAEAKRLADRKSIPLFLPPIDLCTDNAAMIAAQGYYEYVNGKRASWDLNARAHWELGEVMA